MPWDDKRWGLIGTCPSGKLWAGAHDLTFSCGLLFPLGGSRLELRIFVTARTSKQTRGLQQRLNFWLCLHLVWLALPLLQSRESETFSLVLWGSPSKAGTESIWDFILYSYHPLFTEDSLSASQRTLPSSLLCLSYSNHCSLAMVCFSQDKGADLGLERPMHWQRIAVKITYLDWRRISIHIWHVYVCCWPLTNLLLSCLE